jgi:hypothetical protein
MVYFSTLSSLIEIIRSKNLKPMKAWSFRHRNDQDGRLNRHLKKLKSQVREILRLVSGNNITEMLKGLVIHWYFLI